VTIATDIAADYAAMLGAVPVTVVRGTKSMTGAASNKRTGKDYDPVTGGYADYSRTVRISTAELSTAGWTPAVGDKATVQGVELRVIGVSEGPWGVWRTLDFGSKEA